MYQTGLHIWKNLVGLENLKIPGFHFYGTIKLFIRVGLARFVKVLSFPKTSWMSKETAKLVHDSTTFVGHIPVILKLIFILSFFICFAIQIITW